MHVKTQAALTGLVLVAATALITLTDLDRETARLFYLEGSGFVAGDRQPWRALYRYGKWPALLLAASALICLAAGFFRTGLRRCRRACVFLLLVYLLGPGLLINGMLKTHWDRPRPVDVVDFGGAQSFVQLSAPTFDGPEGRSFPSGHASVAFYLAAPWFLLRSTNRRAARRWLEAGLACGGLMGLARMAQGAHFLSDIVWSWGIVHLLGLLLAHWLRLDHSEVPLRLPGPAGIGLPIRPTFVGWVRAWPAVLQALRVRAAAAVSRLCAAGIRDSRDPQTDPAATQIRHFLVRGPFPHSARPYRPPCRSAGHGRGTRGHPAGGPGRGPGPAAGQQLRGRRPLAPDHAPPRRARFVRLLPAKLFQGGLFNQGLPSSIGGDGLRILDVARLAGHREDAVFGVFIDRFVGLAGLVLLNLAALLVNRSLLPDRVALPLLALLTLLTVTLAALFFLARIDLFRQGRLLGFLGRLSARYRQVYATAPAMTLQTGLSLLTHLLAMAAFAVLGHAAGLHYPLQVYLALVPPAVLLTILPVSLAGWGLREGPWSACFSSSGRTGRWCSRFPSSMAWSTSSPRCPGLLSTWANGSSSDSHSFPRSFSRPGSSHAHRHHAPY